MVSGGQWSLPRVSRLVEEVGGALIAAHAAGVVHHDVTTSNVFLDEDGAAYLGDFGIATSDAGSGDGLADVGGDVRDFGGLLWELLTGSDAAAERAPDASLVGHVSAPPPGLDGVLRRAVSGEYASVAELVLGWRAATDGTGTERRSRPASGLRSMRNDGAKHSNSLGRLPPAPTPTAACARSTRPRRRIFTGDDVPWPISSICSPSNAG